MLPKEHPLAQEDGIRLADLGGRQRVLEVTTTVKDAVELVAAGAGVLLVPQSVARLYGRKDVVAVPITDAPETTIALIWLAEPNAEPHDTPGRPTHGQRSAAIDDFVGIVRGRSARSSRGTPTPPTPRRETVGGQAEAGHAHEASPAQAGQRQTTPYLVNGTMAGAHLRPARSLPARPTPARSSARRRRADRQPGHAHHRHSQHHHRSGGARRGRRADRLHHRPQRQRSCATRWWRRCWTPGFAPAAGMFGVCEKGGVWFPITASGMAAITVDDSIAVPRDYTDELRSLVAARLLATRCSSTTPNTS